MHCSKIQLKKGKDWVTSVKRITVGYVQLHNIKYGRTDHLFQNRFNSEAVEEEQYLMTVELAIEAMTVTGKTSGTSEKDQFFLLSS